MKKTILLIFLFCIFSIKLNADSSFLSGLEFQYMYEDDPVLWNTKDVGIDEKSYLDYLFSEVKLLGEKVALLSSLSSYFEWIDVDDNPDNDDENYFADYTVSFTAKLLEKYQVTHIEDKKIPAEYRLLYMLMKEYEEGFYGIPSVAKYQEFIDAELPNSLTGQAIKVRVFAYEIIYDHSRRVANIISMYDNQYRKPFAENWKNYEQDIRPKIYQKIMEDLQFMEIED